MVRHADKAGTWYPEDARGCGREIGRYIEDAVLPEFDGTPVAAMAPHAGWDFAGSTIGHSFAFLRERAPEVVVLFGADHVGLHQSAIFPEGEWETPLGPLQVHAVLAEEIGRLTGGAVGADMSAHRVEHSIEIVAPFVKACFPEAQIVPILAPPTGDPIQVGEAVGRALDEAECEAVIIGSTDLTHYGPNYGFAPHGVGQEGLDWVRRENDRRILELAAAMGADQVVSEARRSRSACGSGAMAATISAARALGATRGHILAYTTSHDVLPMGPPTSFVGYGAVGYTR